MISQSINLVLSVLINIFIFCLRRTRRTKNFKLLLMMIQQLKREPKKKKITEFPRASNPYAELLKLYIFIHIKNFK